MVGLGSLAAGDGAVLSTGAFTQVETEREISIEVVADDGALPGLRVNDDYATGGDQVEIAIGGEDFDADGLNLDAKTELPDVLLVTDDGTETVTISVSEAEASQNDSPDASFDSAFTGDYDGDLQDGFSGTGASSTADDSQLDPGESAVYSLITDFGGVDLEPGPVDATATINAEVV